MSQSYGRIRRDCEILNSRRVFCGVLEWWLTRDKWSCDQLRCLGIKTSSAGKRQNTSSIQLLQSRRQCCLLFCIINITQLAYVSWVSVLNFDFFTKERVSIFMWQLYCCSSMDYDLTRNRILLALLHHRFLLRPEHQSWSSVIPKLWNMSAIHLKFNFS